MKKSPVEKRNIRSICIVSFLTVIFVIALLSTQVVNVSGLLKLGNNFRCFGGFFIYWSGHIDFYC